MECLETYVESPDHVKKYLFPRKQVDMDSGNYLSTIIPHCLQNGQHGEKSDLTSHYITNLPTFPY